MNGKYVGRLETCPLCEAPVIDRYLAEHVFLAHLKEDKTWAGPPLSRCWCGRAVHYSGLIDFEEHLRLNGGIMQHFAEHTLDPKK